MQIVSKPISDGQIHGCGIGKHFASCIARVGVASSSKGHLRNGGSSSCAE